MSISSTLHCWSSINEAQWEEGFTGPSPGWHCMMFLVSPSTLRGIIWTWHKSEQPHIGKSGVGRELGYSGVLCCCSFHPPGTNPLPPCPVSPHLQLSLGFRETLTSLVSTGLSVDAMALHAAKMCLQPVCYITAYIFVRASDYLWANAHIGKCNMWTVQSLIQPVSILWFWQLQKCFCIYCRACYQPYPQLAWLTPFALWLLDWE